MKRAVFFFFQPATNAEAPKQLVLYDEGWQGANYQEILDTFKTTDHIAPQRDLHVCCRCTVTTKETTKKWQLVEVCKKS